MIVVLDCNIWITLTINGKLDFISNLLDKGIEIASCETLRTEIADVLSRPKLSKFIPADSLEKLIQLHDLVTVRFKLTAMPKVVSDEKDNYLFALCLKSKAAYFITGDKLLLNVSAYKYTRVITLSTFKSMVNN